MDLAPPFPTMPRAAVFVLGCTVIGICCNSCLAFPKFPDPKGQPPAHAARPVDAATEEHLRAIEKAVRHLAGQLDDVDRLEALVEVRRAWESEPLLGNDGAKPIAVRRWIVWLIVDELDRRSGTWNLDDLYSGAVARQPGKLAPLLNAADITTPEDWVEFFLMPSDPGASAQPEQFRVYEQGFNGLEASGYVSQFHRFSHINFEGHKLRKVTQSGDSYDHVIRSLYSENAFAATTTLLPVVTKAAREDVAAVVYSFIIVDAKLHLAIAKLPPDQRGRFSVDPLSSVPDPYTPEVREIMLELAKSPDWPIHLYILKRMEGNENMRDPEVIERMLSHGDPVTERFVANYKAQLEQRRQAAEKAAKDAGE